MFKKIIQRIRFKKMARHLRKPTGDFGIQVGVMMNKSNELLYDFTLDAMQPGPDVSILEIGFGNGKFFDKVMARAAGIIVSGIDYSETMVAVARQNNTDLINEGRLNLQAGSSEQLPYPDISFDKVFNINVVYFWEDPVLHLKEIYRVLKPGGKFYTTVRTKESLNYLPFTRFGFTVYSVEEWKALTDSQQFKFISVTTLDEPPRDFQGKTFRFQSLCMVAQK